MNIEPTELQKNKLTPEMEAEGCEAHLTSRWRERYATDHPDKIKFFKKHLLFITVTFNRQNISLPGHHRLKPTPIGAYSQLTYHVMRKMMGENFRRTRPFQPLQLGWIDFDGSRTAHKIIPNISKNPHLHLTALVSPEHRLPFMFGIKDWVTRTRLVMASDIYKQRMEDDLLKYAKWVGLPDDYPKPYFPDWMDRLKTCSLIESIDVQQYDPNKNSVLGLIGYCMKGYAKLPAKERENYQFILPK